uniref:Uncharacterized protein n=1 Tax=Arundo donax TaxID=35708 RepID=A0A0A8ZED3_ARUDO
MGGTQLASGEPEKEQKTAVLASVKPQIKLMARQALALKVSTRKASYTAV